VTIDRTIWRADLFDQLAGEAGSFAAAHYHPEFTDNEPCSRVWDPGLTADPFGWLRDQVATLGGGRWHVEQEDARELRGLAATVVALARQYSPEICTSGAACFELTRDVKDAVRLMTESLREPSLLDADRVAQWLR
jgi:hypothetical protein